jgi:hypothetical protein
MKNIIRKFIFIFLVMLIVSCGTQRGTIEREIGIRAINPSDIPMGYATYTFFLSPSKEYANFTSALAVKKLEQKFDEFGKNIGDKNIAVLPVNIRGRFDDYQSKELLDKISYRYQNLALSYNKGPFIIVLNHHLDDPVKKNDAAVSMSFSGGSSPRIIEGLNYIEEGIRRKQIFKRNVQFYEGWLKVKNWLDKVDPVKLKDFIIEVVKVFA